MSKYVSIGQAAGMLGVSTSTLRRWDTEGKLVAERTPGGRRRYSADQVRGFNPLVNRREPSIHSTIAYARVSSHDQVGDLDRQVAVLEMYCAAQGWQYEVIRDIGSGVDYRKKGLTTLIEQILDGQVGRLVLTHQDRLLRFGAELIFSICEAKAVEVVVITSDDDRTFEEELAADVLEIITVFSPHVRVRSYKNKRLIDDVERALSDAQSS